MKYYGGFTIRLSVYGTYVATRNDTTVVADTLINLIRKIDKMDNPEASE